MSRVPFLGPNSAAPNDIVRQGCVDPPVGSPLLGLPRTTRDKISFDDIRPAQQIHPSPTPLLQTHFSHSFDTRCQFDCLPIAIPIPTHRAPVSSKANAEATEQLKEE